MNRAPVDVSRPGRGALRLVTQGGSLRVEAGMRLRFAPSRHLLAPVVAAILLAGSACGESVLSPVDGEPVVQVLTPTATAGSMVDVRLENPTRTDWGYNLCSTARLEILINNRWQSTPEPLRICAAVLNSLDAGASIESSVHVPLGYEAGTYRVKVTFWRAIGDPVSVVSGAFTVE